MTYNIDKACADAKNRLELFIEKRATILSHAMRDEYWASDNFHGMIRMNKERREAITGWSKYAQLYNLSNNENTALRAEIRDLKEKLKCRS